MAQVQKDAGAGLQRQHQRPRAAIEAQEIHLSKIEDAGELIPDAKKHQAQLRGPRRKTQEANGRLAQLWPEPDWLTLSQQRRYAPDTLAALACIYWSLGTGPIERACFGVEAHAWPAMYDRAIAVIRQVFVEANNESLPQLRQKAMALSGIDARSSLSERMALGAAGRFGGRTLQPPFSLLPKLGLLYRSMADLGWPQDDSCLKAGIGVACTDEARRQDEQVWGVASTLPKPVFISSSKLTYREALVQAREAVQERLNHNAEQVARRKAVTSKAAAGFGERVGVDVLGGGDIGTEELMDTFRLRGVQFGASLSTREKQAWINESFCALHDLARVIGFKPAWLGMGNASRDALALAFGARGQGGAMAHYEPSLQVFNLSRLRGAGSLAHEWGHGLDHYLGAVTFAQSNCYGSNTRQLLSEMFECFDRPKERHQRFDCFTRLYQELGQRGEGTMYAQALRIEALRGARKNYWISRSEILARSFEAYVQDCLIEQGHSSPWLVFGTLESDQKELALSAYPVGEQRQRLKVLWQAFFASLTSL